MLIACFAMTPPDTEVLQKIENTDQSRARVVGLEPGDLGLAAEPRELTLGEAAGGPDRLLDRLVETDLPSDVLGELTVANRLERRRARVPAHPQEVLDLLHPPCCDHRRHSIRDAIVQDASRQRQTDAEGRNRRRREGAAGDPPGLRAA